MKKHKTAKEINDDSIDKWVQSFSEKKKVRRKRIKPTITIEDLKVIGEPPVIVPANQLNLFL